MVPVMCSLLTHSALVELLILLTGLPSGLTTSSYVVPALISVFEDSFENKTDIESTVFECFFSGEVEFTPNVGDTVVDANGVNYVVRKVDPSYLGTSKSSWLCYLES